MNQSRWQSPVLRTGMVSILIWALKEFAGYELDNQMADTAVTVAFIIIFAVCNVNNPKDKKNI